MSLTDAQWRALKALETGETHRNFMVSWMALRARGLVYWPEVWIEGRPLLTDAGRALLKAMEAGQ